jgi:hypothetical protein
MHMVRPEHDTQGRLEKALNHPIEGKTVYGTQLEQLRQQVRDDPNHFYTYSPEFMSLSVDPYLMHDVNKARDEEHKSKFLVKGGFQNVIKRNKKECIKHPKYLPESTVEAIHNYPYHEEKAWVGLSYQDSKSAEAKRATTKERPEGVQELSPAIRGWTFLNF